MRIPFLTRFASKFKTTAQLAHVSAHDVHKLQAHMREQYRTWEEIKEHLRKISELEKELPKGERHKVMVKVFDRIDALEETLHRVGKAMESLNSSLENIERHAEHDAKSHPIRERAERLRKKEEKLAQQREKLERKAA